ncbi:MAG: sulfatase-like hydrolase/transferase [Spirochaetia bacterium]
MSNRPNVLLIMTDQHTADVSGYRGDSAAETPNLDKLASKSVDFPNAVTPSPVCTPARMCMLTGKLPYNCSAWQNHWILFPEHLTMPRHFSDHGYTSALIGKMHFGGRDQMNGYGRRPYGDLRHGLGHQPEPLDIFPAYGGPKSAGVSEIPESLNSDVVITREALSYLLEHNSESPDSPWFVTVSYTRPHPPFTAPGRYLKKYRNMFSVPDGYYSAADSLEPYAADMAKIGGYGDLSEEEVKRGIEGYYGCIDFVDDCIGELLDSLDRSGMLENTYVVYLADHGEMLGSHGLWAKAVYYENAVKIPLLISGPDIAAQGTSLQDPVSLTDIFPTLCGLTGLPVPPGLDGNDFSLRLKAPGTAEPVREYCESMFFKYGTRIVGGNLRDYRDRDGELTPGAAMRLLRSPEWKYVSIEGAEPLLFNLTEDPGETVNLSGDPRFAEIEKTMAAELESRITWEEIHRRLKADKERVPEFLSGQKPSTPNQYMLPDGRIFDAEKALYDSRWLFFDPRDARGGGIIPQMFG